MKDNSFYLCNQDKKLENNIDIDFWLSIQKKCLPLIRVSDNDSLTDIFNEDSFINLNNFKNPNEVYEFIKNIPKDDYINRLNSCIEVINNFVNSDEYKNRNNGKFTSLYNFLKDAQNGEIVLIEENEKVRKQKKRQELINRLRQQQRGRQMNRRRPNRRQQQQRRPQRRPRQQQRRPQRRPRQQQRRPQHRPRHQQRPQRRRQQQRPYYGNRYRNRNRQQGANRRQQHYYQRLRYLQMRQNQLRQNIQQQYGLDHQIQNQQPQKYTHKNNNWRQQVKSSRSQVLSNDDNVIRDIIM